MQFLFAGLVLVGLVPLIAAWRAHRADSLAHAVLWAIAAWLVWGITFLADDDAVGRYIALSLTGCAGIAVLGARRPHVGAWNFVVLGLFAVMILPLTEALLIGTRSADTLRIFFMAATIAVGVLNYLPTRFAPAALCLAGACAGHMLLLFAPAWLPENALFLPALLLIAVPWVGWACVRGRKAKLRPIDRLWLDFRDGWGVLWAQRVREQFNRALASAGSSATLRWSGIIGLEEGEEMLALETLRAILQRFVAPA